MESSNSVRANDWATTVPQLTNGQHFFSVIGYISIEKPSLDLYQAIDFQYFVAKMSETVILAANFQWHSL